MPDQLRMYAIKPGEMEAWLEEWERQIAPLRRQLGFEILGAWTTESDQFVWILRYAGPKTWEDADAAYYASAERARARRAQTSLLTLAVAAIGLFTGQLQAELLGGPDASISPHTGYRILLVAALVSAVLAAAFLFRLRAGLLAAALSVALLVAAISSILRLQLEHGWAVEAVFLITGAILVAAAEYGRRQKVLWATEVLAFAGP